MFKQSFVPWKFHSRHAAFEPSTSKKDSIKQVNILKGLVDAKLAANPEAYVLNITEDGVVNISAETSIGLLRGLATFSQLFYEHSDVRGRR